LKEFLLRKWKRCKKKQEKKFFPHDDILYVAGVSDVCPERMEGVLWKKSKGKGIMVKSQWIERYYILNDDTKELTCYQESKGFVFLPFSI
jgi:hypothetical protein